jgi:plasmid stability protein
MAQLLIRNVDDERLDRLRARAKSLKRSVESLARDALHAAADDTAAERLALAQEMQEWSRKAKVAGSTQTLGVHLIREARDNDR